MLTVLEHGTRIPVNEASDANMKRVEKVIRCNCTHLIRTPIDFRIACVKASVLLISRLYISDPAMLVNGVSIPRAWAIPIAIAVLPNKLK